MNRFLYLTLGLLLGLVAAALFGSKKNKDLKFVDLGVGLQYRQESTASIAGAASLLDEVHRCFLRSGFRRKIGLQVSYLGLLRRRSQESGFLEGMPGAWTFYRVNNDGQRVDEIFVILCETGKGISVRLEGGREIEFKLTTEGRDITNGVVSIEGVSYKGENLLRSLIRDFQ